MTSKTKTNEELLKEWVEKFPLPEGRNWEPAKMEDYPKQGCHLYTIGPKHLEYSEGVYLDVEGAERKGAGCYHEERDGRGLRSKCGQRHSDPIHATEKVLFIEQPFGKDELISLDQLPGCQGWLLQVKAEAEEQKIEIGGFVFPKKQS